MIDNPGVFHERHWYAQDGVRLFVREYGAGADRSRLPVVCLSGLARNSSDFHDVARRLTAQGRRVICPDYRGRGRSADAPDWRTYRPRHMLADLLDLLTVYNIRRALFVGTSFGGLLSTGLAVARPGVVEAVVLNDIGPEIGSVAMGSIVEQIGDAQALPDWTAAVEYLKRRNPPEFELPTEEAWWKFARATFREAPDGSLRVAYDVRLARTLAVGEQDAAPLWDYYRALAPIPTLALRGAVSNILTQATFDRMAEVKPDLRRVVVPGVGHAPCLHEPTARDALDGFLATFP